MLSWIVSRPTTIFIKQKNTVKEPRKHYWVLKLILFTMIVTSSPELQTSRYTVYLCYQILGAPSTKNSKVLALLFALSDLARRYQQVTNLTKWKYKEIKIDIVLSKCEALQFYITVNWISFWLDFLSEWTGNLESITFGSGNLWCAFFKKKLTFYRLNIQ